MRIKDNINKFKRAGYEEAKDEHWLHFKRKWLRDLAKYLKD